ncbi:hypothetical protein [Paraburkholderia sp. BL10I2N1]|uniref:hypothetical protein n=1 Tax=Paraburkholderia sp. BL10I2N1 TaxID=1938796 RepID=UPI0010622B72|nr:hypothetical protein [Paraburkholderia sp. BL10I2N1]
MNESQIRSLDQVRAILDGTHTLDFSPAASPHERHEWVASVLRRFRYNQLKRFHRGLVLRYLRRFSGFSRAHMTRLVQRWMLGHRLVRVKGAPANAFARRYTDEGVFTLAEAEREYGRLSGPAMVVVLRRMYQVYNDERFERLQQLSSSHLYNLRRSHAYRLHNTTYTKTGPNPKARQSPCAGLQRQRTAPVSSASASRSSAPIT